MEAAILLTAKLACQTNTLQTEYTIVKVKLFFVLLGTLVQYVEFSVSESFICRRSQHAVEKGVNL